MALSSSSDSAGPIGAILLLLTWLYFGGLILLVGAVVNATHSGHIEIDSDESEDASLEGIPEDAAREPFVDDAGRERERLEAQLAALRRERDQLRNDREAQRTRRYRLEDRVDGLETENRTLTDENEQLRRKLAARQGSWRRRLHGILAGFGR